MVHPRLIAARCALLATILWNAPALAGKLSDLREETSSSSQGSDRSGGNGSDNEQSWLFLLLFGNDDAYSPGYSSTVVDARDPRVMLQQAWYFPLYPYRGGVPGNLARRNFTFAAPVPSGCTNTDSNCHRSRQVVACVDSTCYSETHLDDGPEHDTEYVPRVQSSRAQLQLDLGTTNDGLWRGAVSGAIDSHLGMGLESKLTYWVEPQPTEPSDATLLGDVGVRLALFSSPALQLRLGGGARFQVDSSSEAMGANGSLTAELYPFDPLIVRVEGDIGNLGKAFVYEAQASLGFVLRRTEILAGISRLHVGSVALDNMFAGLRFHL